MQFQFPSKLLIFLDTSKFIIPSSYLALYFIVMLSYHPSNLYFKSLIPAMVLADKILQAVEVHFKHLSSFNPIF